MDSTSIDRTPVIKSTSEQLDDAMAERNELVNLIQFTYTARYSKAFQAFHEVSASIQEPDPRPAVVLTTSTTSTKTTLRLSAELHQTAMCVAEEKIRLTRETLAHIEKKIVELEMEVAAEKGGLHK